jgi:predicted kinase
VKPARRGSVPAVGPTRRQDLDKSSFHGYMPLMESSGTGAKLIIVCGLPGSGKTTLAKRLEGRSHAVRLPPDEWMDALSINLHDEESRAKIEALQWKFGQELLKLGHVVVVEWGTWGRSERDALRLGARDLGAAVELHYVSAPPRVLFERIQRRGRENPPIEQEVLSQWFETFQAPTNEGAPPQRPGVSDAGRRAFRSSGSCCATSGVRSSMRPMRRIPNGSSKAVRTRPICRRRCGSTRPRRKNPLRMPHER